MMLWYKIALFQPTMKKLRVQPFSLVLIVNAISFHNLNSLGCHIRMEELT